MKIFKLSEPTAFPDLNKKSGAALDFETSELPLQTLKYKHFRQVMQFPEQDQMHHLMMIITGLTEDDLGELTPDDTAEISGYVYDSMRKYLQLGKRIMSSMDDK